LATTRGLHCVSGAAFHEGRLGDLLPSERELYAAVVRLSVEVEEAAVVTCGGADSSFSSSSSRTTHGVQVRPGSLGGRVEPAGGPDEDEEEEHEHKGEGVEDVEPDFFGLERGGCGEGAGGRKRERERDVKDGRSAFEKKRL
jgi:hypothetical protein